MRMITLKSYEPKWIDTKLSPQCLDVMEQIEFTTKQIAYAFGVPEEYFNEIKRPIKTIDDVIKDDYVLIMLLRSPMTNLDHQLTLRFTALKMAMNLFLDQYN